MAKNPDLEKLSQELSGNKLDKSREISRGDFGNCRRGAYLGDVTNRQTQRHPVEAQM
jgi:hypothetical protein